VVANISNYSAVGVGVARLFDQDRCVGELALSKYEAPLNFSIDGEGSGSSSLQIQKNNEVVVGLKNNDDIDYAVSVSLSAGGMETPAQSITIGRNTSTLLRFVPSPEWFDFETRFRSQPTTIYAVVRLSMPNTSGRPNWVAPTHKVPLNAKLSSFSLLKMQRNWFVVVFIVLFFGGISFLAINTVLPNVLKKLSYRKKLQELATATSAVSTQVDSHLRVLLRLERLRLQQLLVAVNWITRDVGDIFQQVEIGINGLSKRLVGPDGNAYVLSVGTNVNYNYNSCSVQQTSTDPAPPRFQITQIMGTLNFSESVALIRITPEGVTSEIPVSSVSYSGGARWQGSWFFDDPVKQLPFVNLDKFAPDGQGGMLVTWNQRTSAQGDLYHGMLSRVLDGNVTYTVADGAPAQTNVFAPAPTVGDIASNDQGTAFFDVFDFTSLSHVTTAVDVLTGTANWTSNTGLIAATDDGGVIVQDGQGIKSLDTTGSPTLVGIPDIGDFAYLDPGVYTYLNAYSALSAVREPQPQSQQTQPLNHKTISRGGFPIVRIGHTANRIAPHSPANFTPVANCTGFDGDDAYGLHYGALMVPQNGSNSLRLTSTGASILGQ